MIDEPRGTQTLVRFAAEPEKVDWDKKTAAYYDNLFRKNDRAYKKSIREQRKQQRRIAKGKAPRVTKVRRGSPYESVFYGHPTGAKEKVARFADGVRQKRDNVNSFMNDGPKRRYAKRRYYAAGESVRETLRANPRVGAFLKQEKTIAAGIHAFTFANEENRVRRAKKKLEKLGYTKEQVKAAAGKESGYTTASRVYTSVMSVPATAQLLNIGKVVWNNEQIIRRTNMKNTAQGLADIRAYRKNAMIGIGVMGGLSALSSVTSRMTTNAQIRTINTRASLLNPHIKQTSDMKQATLTEKQKKLFLAKNKHLVQSKPPKVVQQATKMSRVQVAKKAALARWAKWRSSGGKKKKR